jgi:hypothetical protein
MRSRRRPVVVRAPKGADREAFLDAAYRLIDRAWVRLDEKSGVLSAVLTPRGTAAGLAEDLRAAYAAAAALRLGERRARPLRAALLSRALELADHVDERRADPPPALPPQRLAEIAALLAEDAAAPRDPLGLRVPWEELRKGRVA